MEDNTIRIITEVLLRWFEEKEFRVEWHHDRVNIHGGDGYGITSLYPEEVAGRIKAALAEVEIIKE